MYVRAEPPSGRPGRAPRRRCPTARAGAKSGRKAGKKPPEYARFFVPLSEIGAAKSPAPQTANNQHAMKGIAGLLLAGALLVSCGGSRTRAARTAEPPAEPKQYTYTVLNTYPHSTQSYTQGLQFADGMLWEGTGQHGQSVLRKTDLATGRTEVVARLPRSEFGEGITLLDGKVYQLTWQSNKAYVWDAATGEKMREYRYPGEGWGLTTDGRLLYMSDGSEYIHTVDPATFRRLGSTAVTLAGAPVKMLNELEWIDGRIWANVYMTDQIVIIDPATGVVEGIIDLTGLLPAEEVGPETDVLNGIARDPDTGRIFVTGKNWDKIFEIEIHER